MGLSYETRHLVTILARHKHPTAEENLTGVPRLIFSDPANHANSGVAVTTLETVSIPAGRLVTTGDFIEYVAAFDLAPNANSKTITYAFGGQNLNGNPWNNTLGNVQMVITGRVYRTGATTCRSYIEATLPFLAQADPFTQFTDIVVANLNTTPLNFVVTAQGGASNDIIQRTAHLFITNL
jgi:hypothetical protein